MTWATLSGASVPREKKTWLVTVVPPLLANHGFQELCYVQVVHHLAWDWKRKLLTIVTPLSDHCTCCHHHRDMLCSGGASAGVGPYVEVVFLHKQSKTLIVTDAVVCVPPSPPQVVRTANLLEAGSPLPGEYMLLVPCAISC